EETFRLAYGRTFYGTGYYIYHLYAPGLPLSRPIESWDGVTPPDPEVLDLLSRAGTDIAPTDIDRLEGHAAPRDDRSAILASIDGPAVIRALKFEIPRDKALDFERARLRMTWDGRPEPSVDAPVSLFFGAGTLFNRDNREWLVKALPVTIRFDESKVYL